MYVSTSQFPMVVKELLENSYRVFDNCILHSVDTKSVDRTLFRNETRKKKRFFFQIRTIYSYQPLYWIRS